MNRFLVASITFGRPGLQEQHVMVLDRYDIERDVLIFKNTYDNPDSGLTKKFEIKRTDPNAPAELYFVNIEVEDMANLLSHEERVAMILQERKRYDPYYRNPFEWMKTKVERRQTDDESNAANARCKKCCIIS